MQPRNLIIAKDQSIADGYIQAFGLDANDWMSGGSWQALQGRQFDRIVVVSPAGQPFIQDPAAFQERIGHLQTRLSKDGVISII